MDTDPQIKIQPQPPVHEAVHVCRKCGWMFINAHPSARHRRAHKKICGTIEGYKVVASNGSDAGGHSDEDCKTPRKSYLYQPAIILFFLFSTLVFVWL